MECLSTLDNDENVEIRHLDIFKLSMHMGYYIEKHVQMPMSFLYAVRCADY